MLDKLGSASRVNILAFVTALVVGYVRHGLQTGWKQWDGFEQFIGSWIIHYFALLFLVAIAGTAISSWHEFFLNEKREFTNNIVKYQYYISTVILIATLAVWIFAKLPPGTFSAED